MSLSKVTILGIPITVEPEHTIISTIEKSIQKKKSLFITTPNPEIIVEAQKNELFLKALLSSDIALPDGTGILFALKRKGISIPRIRGREFFELLLILANKYAWNVFLLGASEESNKKSIERILHMYPNINIQGSGDITVNKTGTWAEGNNKTEEEYIHEIQMFSPHLLFVAFGHPKQELWSSRVREKLAGTTIMTIGGTLDYFAGTVKLPPPFMAYAGFEWLYRLIIEPKRIIRIFTAVILFPVYLLHNGN